MSPRAAPTQAELEASRWLARLESDDASLDDHRQFRAWLAASPENQPAFDAMSDTWRQLGSLKHVGVAAAPRTTPRRRMFILIGAGAAAALAASLALIFLQLAPPNAASYVTAIGEHRTITLDDGSSAELNADTRIRVHYSDEERRVFLDQGEALFDVRANAARPFVVRTEFGAIRVRGTSFVVKLGSDGARATVLRGAIEGEGRDDAFSSFLSRDAGTSIVAAANQEISFRDGDVARTDLAEQAAQRRVAWRDGMLAFDGETLEEAVSEVERQTGVHFEFEDPELRQVRVGGYISANSAEPFLELLRGNFGIAAEHRANAVVVLRRTD